MDQISVYFKGLLATIVASLLAWHASIGGVVPLPINTKFVTAPAVFDVGDGYAVMWATDKKGMAWVTFEVDGKEYTVYDSASGTIRTDETLHAVKVDKDLFDQAGSYRVHSAYILFNFGYITFRGAEAVSQAYDFRGYEGQETIRGLFFADVHGQKEMAYQNTALLTQDAPADFVVLGGDIARDWLLTQKTFVDEILDLAVHMSGSGIPVVYVRGNHECRGAWATQMRNYFPTPTGELYFTTSYGPIGALVLDTGEDKDDDDPQYGGLADFDAYRKQHLNWIKGLRSDTFDAYEYKVCYAHKYNFNVPAQQSGENWAIPVRALGIPLTLTGHGHTNKVFSDAESGMVIFEDGGTAAGSLATFSGGQISVKTRHLWRNHRRLGRTGHVLSCIV
ncbi:MAG: metallophosphoesterase [Oscillospiraceae bacterium]|jgi:predicted phosphodiesterase|nr:metallophosphoesterase [Oscillospiraceae bacterium]